MKLSILFVLTITILYSCGGINAQEPIPECIQEKITAFKAEPVADPPLDIYQYTHNNELVYLISAPCCDIYTQLVNSNCEIICHPSGGITGAGDLKCGDIIEKMTDKKLIWKDKRKPKK